MGKYRIGERKYVDGSALGARPIIGKRSWGSGMRGGFKPSVVRRVVRTGRHAGGWVAKIHPLGVAHSVLDAVAEARSTARPARNVAEQATSHRLDGRRRRKQLWARCVHPSPPFGTTRYNFGNNMGDEPRQRTSKSSPSSNGSLGPRLLFAAR
jgi:hypothetical protein